MTANLALRLGIFVDSSSGEVDKLDAIWPKPTLGNLLGSPVSATTNWSECVAHPLVFIFVWLVIFLVIAFVVSFYFSANTIIYALLRKKVDNTSLEEVYIRTGTEQYPDVFFETTAKGAESSE